MPILIQVKHDLGVSRGLLLAGIAKLKRVHPSLFRKDVSLVQAQKNAQVAEKDLQHAKDLTSKTLSAVS